LDSTIDSIEAPWGARIERELRAEFEVEDLVPYVVSLRLYEKVGELGLEPFNPPEPLPIIDEDESTLICWMLVDSED